MPVNGDVRAKKMNGVIRNILLVLVVLEALALMVPTTSMYLFGLGFSILGFFQANKGVFTPAFLYIAGLLLIPGYALYSLWWLVFSYRKLTLNTIPIHIWVGLLTGIVVTIFVFSPFSISPPTEHISHTEHFETNLVFGLGPLVVATTLLLIVYAQTCSNE